MIGAVVLAAVLIVALSAALIPFLAIFILVAVCFGAYYLITSRSLEYEYSITNGDITIDSIIYRRKRKRVISLDAHSIEAMGIYKPEEHSGKSYDSRIFASTSYDGRDANSWYFTARHPQMGNVLVVFNPEEKVRNAIKPFLPRQVARDAFGRN